MDNQQHKSKKPQLKFLRTNSNRSLILGSVVATLIATTPFLFTIYESVPATKVWNTFLFTYNSNWYENAQVAAWTMSNKLIPLYLFFIWFFTCRQWWYHTLLVPIVLYIYQIIGILNDDLEFADTNLFLYLLPVMAVVIPSIYLIRAKMFNKINDADKSMEELEEEFKIRPKGIFSKLKDYF
ncbi:hypothetical protein ACS386_14100 [Flavobacteriaceae bacterium LMO-SS05]